MSIDYFSDSELTSTGVKVNEGKILLHTKNKHYTALLLYF